jgi:hypothetical protein
MQTSGGALDRDVEAVVSGGRLEFYATKRVERKADWHSRRAFAEAQLDGPCTISDEDPSWDDLWTETTSDEDPRWDDLWTETTSNDE